MKKWKTLRSHLVLNSRWCKIRQDEVQLPNGDLIDDFFINIKPDVALVVPVTGDREIVLVRQYRHGVGEILLEVPAGSFDPKLENAELAAARELTEETGYVAKSLIPLATLYNSPLKDTNKLHVFIALNVEMASQQSLDPTEDIEVVCIPAVEILDRIANGEICVCGSVTAILLGLKFLNIS